MSTSSPGQLYDCSWDLLDALCVLNQQSITAVRAALWKNCLALQMLIVYQGG